MDSEKETDAHKGSSVGDWSTTSDFFGAILAGLLLGLLGDAWLDTAPWLVVIGVIAGFGVGFMKMYEFSKKIEDQAEAARRHRDGS
jgi:F0F1-type ATP synthase assembly protein I